MRTRLARIAVAAIVCGLSAALAPAARANEETPYLGWSSWSVQALRSDVKNPFGNYSWLSEDNLVAQVDYMAEHLLPYGYDVLAIDAGWWRQWDWTPVYDEYGRPAVWPTRHPRGMRWFMDYARSKGLKVGIYLPAGIESGKEGTNPGIDFANTHIYNAPECRLEDAVYPDHRVGNRFNSGYLLDFDNGTGCARKYIESLVALFESWGGVDLLKIDGWQDRNLRELQEYRRAFDATGHHTHIQLSWSIPRATADTYVPYADSWRTGGDIECRFMSQCTTYARWNEVAARLNSVVSFEGVDGPGKGWNNLDSLLVGSATLGGLTQTERQTEMSLWSIAASPLYLGEDLRDLDAYGLSLVTNRDVLAVDQDSLGASAHLVARSGNNSYIFSKKLADGELAVGLFNASTAPLTLTTTAAEAGLPPASGTYRQRDLWTKEERVTDGSISVTLPAHGSVLLRLAALTTDEEQASAGGTVPATLSLDLDALASFGAFTPGVAQTYSAATTAGVTSTAGDSVLSVTDPSATATGHLVNGAFSLPQPLQVRARNATNTGTAFNDVTSPLNLLAYDGPISNDAVTLQFSQAIGASDALRTGTYSKTLTFTLSTTQP